MRLINMRTFVLILKLSIMIFMCIIITSCYSVKLVEYPKDWSPIVKLKENKCSHIAGTYENVSVNHVVYPDLGIRYKPSISLSMVGTSGDYVDKVKFSFSENNDLRILFFDHENKIYKEKLLKEKDQY